MPFGGERKPEAHDKPHPYEAHPKPKPDPKPATIRKLGETAVKGVSKDKNKK